MAHLGEVSQGQFNIEMDDEHIQRLLDGIKETLGNISEKQEQNDPDFQCDQSDKQLKPHVKDKKKIILLKKQCLVCDKFIKKRNFKEHTESHKAKFSNNWDDRCKLLCEVCEKPFTYEILIGHMKKVHNKKLNANRKSIHQISQGIQKKVFHSCGVCDLPILFIRYKVKGHVEQLHNISLKEYQDKYIEKQYKCETCEFVCSSSTLLNQHEKEEHEGLVRFGCRACQFKAFRFVTLRTHVSKIHNGTKDLVIEFEKISSKIVKNNRNRKNQSCRICFQIIQGSKINNELFK